MQPGVSLAALLAAAIQFAAPVWAQTELPAVISVSGQATLSVPPDLAQIEAGVTTEAKTAREASETNNTAMGKLLLALKAADIAEKDIQTSRLSLQAENAPNRTSNIPAIVGYRANNRVTVRLREVAKVADTIDALVGAGANDIGGVSFSVSNTSKLLDEAREQAIADARRKAEIYAKAAGVTLGAPLSIAEEGSPALFASRKMGVLAAPVPVAQGEETLHLNVSVSWAIKAAEQ